MKKNILEAISIIQDVRESMPECTNKSFLNGALRELNEALDNHEADMKSAFKDGQEADFNGDPNKCDADSWYETVYKKSATQEEDTIPVTLATIKAKCGWSEYCDITGGNHYMLKEWTVDDREIFVVKKSHAKQLGLI